jgi:hypothetical protein
MNDSDLVTKRLDDMTVKKTLQPWSSEDQRYPYRQRPGGQPRAGCHSRLPGEPCGACEVPTAECGAAGGGHVHFASL